MDKTQSLEMDYLNKLVFISKIEGERNIKFE